MTDELFGDENMPWPEKGDQLFTSADDWWHNVCLNYMPDDWEAYILGYKRAGDLLVENVKETRSDQNVIVYPIVFLYRQYIELRLKQLIQSGKELLDEEPKFPKTHKLDTLLNECRPRRNLGKIGCAFSNYNVCVGHLREIYSLHERN